ncbi:V-type ATP synthase subunit I [Marinifilum sp. D714]|uniref:V-type ATP synthase subunit I n=1 Tax=Marinifilum sp. D714 TaxID=2937523 RepID=UPI0027BD6AD7|nr:V-type ATPase 116kDa subunit family protein [Marinifilum sp. D714]MDQ2180202.1 V-type ATP synthase subunit I [Marinifilum sp. D714]
MIVPMQKYSFLIYHKEYKDFLKELQELGVLHVVEKDNIKKAEDDVKHQFLSDIDFLIQFLQKREIAQGVDSNNKDVLKLVEDVKQKQKDLAALQQEMDAAYKELEIAKPWGEFSIESIQKLKEQDIYLRFFIGSKKKFEELLQSNLPVELISENNGKVYFILVQEGVEEISIDAEEVNIPGLGMTEIENTIKELECKIDQINEAFDTYAASSIPLLEKSKQENLQLLKINEVVSNTSFELEEKLMVLEGWVPETCKTEVDEFIKRTKVLHYIDQASLKDKVPILLKNNRFSKLFEPVGAMFSLPSYSELDLTVFFAPFFMLFFGFCLGDAGYGLLFVIGAGLYKFKAKNEIKPFLSLIQLLGVATIVFGAISGTLFGVNLIETEIPVIAEYKSLFLNPDKMFNLALLLGGIQIIYGLFIKAANQIKQYGFVYSLATFGWLITILGGTIYAVLTSTGIIPENSVLLYSILSIGGFFILFFSDPEVNVFSRIGKGVWDVYSTVTGIFGDLLSYIRLFALGLSSAILGFVINDIAMQILGSSKILGPVFFVIFLLIGHTLNILISSLGSFVHPMRLTFVEFYKNAGFQGGGEGYKPFSNKL